MATAFRPGIHEPTPGPNVTHPALHIRDAADAHKVLEAVRLNILPLVRRRLLPHERSQLRSGNVFVWQEADASDPDAGESGLVRWTEGRRWSQSRMRGDFLFYEEKIETTYEEKQAKAARRANKSSDSSIALPPPPKRKDRPSKTDGLTKQTYAVSVRLPGYGAGRGVVETRKWHIVAYFAAADYMRLPVVESYDYLRDIRVPEGTFTNNRTPSPQHHFPSASMSAHSDDTDSPSARGSRSPISPVVELAPPVPLYRSGPPPERHPHYPLALPPPSSSSTHPRISLPPLSSLGYPTRPPFHHRHSASSGQQPHAGLSSEDRRLLDSIRVVL